MIGDLSQSTIVAVEETSRLRRISRKGGSRFNQPLNQPQQNQGGTNLPQKASDAANFWGKTAHQRPTSSVGRMLSTTSPVSKHSWRTGQGAPQMTQQKSPGYDFSQSITLEQQQQTLANLMGTSPQHMPLGGALASALLAADEEVGCDEGLSFTGQPVDAQTQGLYTGKARSTGEPEIIIYFACVLIDS